MAPSSVRQPSSNPLSDSIQLVAGPLSMIFENGDLRLIRTNSHEILQRVYFAIRDKEWGTLPWTLYDLDIEIGDSSFRIDYDARGKMGPIDFQWHTSIEGLTGGTVRWRFRGKAESEFLANRIGLCALHPIPDCAGKSCSIKHVDGTTSTSFFPTRIAPLPLFTNISEVAYEAGADAEITLRFGGDAYETEDQRNWTDASYKTYSRPLSLPYPFLVRTGEEWHQTLELSVRVPETLTSRDNSGTETPVILAIESQASGNLPDIGLQFGMILGSIEHPQVELLKRLNLSHLRADIAFSNRLSKEFFAGACRFACSLGVPLEVGINAPAEQKIIDELLTILSSQKVSVCRWLLFADNGNTGELVNLLSKSFNADLMVGTGKEFVEINRKPERAVGGNGVCFSVSPQVHAFDDRSIIENLPAQGWVVNQAREIAGGRKVAVSPVTFKPHSLATALSATDELDLASPDSFDPRLRSLFGAAWTLGSIKYLSESGAASVTYFEVMGDRGILAQHPHSGNQPKQTSELVWLVYHVFADLAEFRNARCHRITSSAPLHVEAIALESDKRLRILIASLTKEERVVQFPSEIFAGTVSCKSLSASNVELATSDPVSFRQIPAKLIKRSDEAYQFALSGFALMRFDGMLNRGCE